MSRLSGLVSTDSRPLLTRIRRHRLHQIADKLEIPYPPGAPAKRMYVLLEDVPDNQIRTIMAQLEAPVVDVQQEDENGKIHTEPYPQEPEHYTARMTDQVQAELASRIAIDEEDEKEKEGLRAEIERLKKDNQRLTETIETRLAALEQQPAALPDAVTLPLERMLPWQLIQLCKENGIEYKGLSKGEMIAALRPDHGEDTTGRSERDSAEGEGAGQ